MSALDEPAVRLKMFGKGFPGIKLSSQRGAEASWRGPAVPGAGSMAAPPVSAAGSAAHAAGVVARDRHLQPDERKAPAGELDELHAPL